MKNAKSQATIAPLLILAMLAGACGKTAAPQPALESSPLYGAGSSARAVQSALFVRNVGDRIEATQDNATLGRTLVTTLQSASGKDATSSSASYLDDLTSVDAQSILLVAPDLFGAENDPNAARIAFTSGDPAEQPLTTLNLLAAITDYRDGIKSVGQPAAQAIFESKMRSWMPQILAAAHFTYQAGGSPQFRKQFDAILESGINAQKAPGLKPNATVAELADGLAPRTESETEAKSILQRLAIAKDEFDKTTAGQIAEHLRKLTKKDIDAARSKVKEMIGSPSLSDDEKKSRYPVEFHKADAAIGLTGLVIDKVLGQPDTAKKFVSTANTAVKVAKTVVNFKFKELGTQLATGNLLGAATTLADSLGDLSGLMPDEQAQEHQEIMDALTGLRSDLGDFRAEMNSRMDKIDQGLVAINQKLDLQLAALGSLQTSVNELQTAVAGVQKSLQTLTSQVDGLEILTQRGFADLLEHDFVRDYEKCLGPNSLAASARDQVSAQVISDCVSAFYQRAAVDSKSETRTGADQRLESYSEQLAALEGKDAALSLQAVALLAIRHTIDIPESYPANPVDWIAGTESFLEMKVLFPKAAHDSRQEAASVKQLIDAGRKIQATLQSLGATYLLSKVAERYETAFANAFREPLENAQLQTARFDEVTLLRTMLDRMLALTRTQSRYGDEGVAALFDHSDESLPTGEEVQQVFSGVPSTAPEDPLQQLKRREFLAMDRLNQYLKAESDAGRKLPASTLVDATMKRLTTFAAVRGY